MSKSLSTETLNHKLGIVGVLTLVLVLVLIVNVFRIQVVEGQANLALASATNRSRELIRAPRGLILDVNGRRLVNNEPSFNVYVLPSELKQSQVSGMLDRLAELFGVDAADLNKRYERSAFNDKGEVVGERVTLLYNLRYEDFLKNYNKLQEFPGVYIANESKRTYVNAENMAHVLGYLGDISAAELAKRPELDNKASVGKEGLEKSYDLELRGQDGVSIKEQGTSSSDRTWVPRSYESGKSIYLTIDLDWQNALATYLAKYGAAENALGGAAIIMDTTNGEIKALANYPSYDINSFAKGISSAEFNSLLNNDSTPLLNRAISMQIPTGSIFKIVMAAALQQEGAVRASTQYKSGCFELPGGYKLCEADLKNYGTLNLEQALARSSNPYFCQATVALATKYGSDQAAIRKLQDYFARFNLGKLTGIPLPGEQAGAMPSPELKMRLQKEPWYLADLCNTAIGQGLVLATPIQMVSAVSAVVNGGKVYQPQLISQFEDAQGVLTKAPAAKVNSELGIDQQYLDVVKNGMRQAVEYGTSTGLRGLPGDPIAKTGSSEATVRADSGKIVSGAHSWVAGSFKHNGRDYAFVATLQFGGRGFRSVPVIADFLKCLDKQFQQCS
jgi:penicillin-binding protein 2